MMYETEIQKLRRQMAEKYNSANQELKPQIKLCDNCNSDLFRSELCPVTGIFHNKDKIMIGGKFFDKDKTSFNSNELLSALDAMRIRWQEARIKKVRVDFDSINIFQSFIAQNNWEFQRFGIMYGTHDETKNIILVHSIFEINGEKNYEEEKMIDKLASYLGLKRVGIILNNLPRKNFVVSGRELMYIAREQSKFGDHCVMITLSPNINTGELEAHAWQSSEQSVNLYRMGLFSSENNKYDDQYLITTRELEVSQDKKDEKGKSICTLQKPCNMIDTHWMIAPVAIEQFNSDIIRNKFVRMNRPEKLYQSPRFDNLTVYLGEQKKKKIPFPQRLRDFHVLVFLVKKIFDINSDMPIIIDAIMKNDESKLKKFRKIIKEKTSTDV